MILPEVDPEIVTIESEQDGGRFRSPNFPAFDLGEALELAQMLYEREGRAATREGVIVTHWGYGSLSGRARRKLAALKHFGLLEGEGSGKGKLMRLSQLALRILLDPDKKSPAYLQALREAALRPVLIKHLYDEYRNGLPSDETIKYNLLLDKKFTERAANLFVPVFRKTLKIAQLLDPHLGAKAEPQRTGPAADAGETREIFREVHEEPVSEHKGSNSSPADAETPGKAGTSGTSSGPFLTFVLPGDNSVELKLKRRVSVERFRQILAMIENMKLVFIEDDRD